MSRISAGGRDDSKVGLKSQPIAPLPGRANKENAALPKDGILRPIARPAGALKPRASNESRPADAAIRLVHQDQQHRISDSVALPLPLPSVPEQRASLSHARFDYLPLQPRHYKSQPQLRQPQPNLRKTQSRQFDRSDRLPLESIKLTETVPEVPESPELPEAREDTATALAPLEAVLSQEMQPQESGDTVYLDSLCYPVAESQPEVNHAVDYNQIAPELHQDAPTKASSVLHESSYPALSEPEEYWDEDDEDYDDQDQAYTTAHSFRSRDMTMGNVTTVLAPKQTTRVQRELEEARAVVEETMTPEEFEEEAWDVSMVAEYGEDIFEYLRELEVSIACKKLHHRHMLTCFVDQDAAEPSLYGDANRSPLVYAISSYGLVGSSPRALRPPPRDSVPYRQLHRPIPFSQDRLHGQTSAGWCYCHSASFEV